MTEEAKKTVTFCTACHRETNHSVVFEYLRSWEAYDDFDNQTGFEHHERSEILVCMGCETVAFRQVDYDDDEIAEIDPETDLPVVNITSYAPPSSPRRSPLPLWRDELPSSAEALKSLLSEVYVAIDAGALTLATTGIRTLIETVMIAKVKDQGNFPRNLDAFEKQGFIARKQVDVVKRTIDAGNASAHRAFTPSQADVKVLLDIAENLIENVFIHPVRMKAASRRVPKRKRKKLRAVQMPKNPSRGS